MTDAEIEPHWPPRAAAGDYGDGAPALPKTTPRVWKGAPQWSNDDVTFKVVAGSWWMPSSRMLIVTRAWM